MFLKNHREKPSALLMNFASFALAIIFLCGAANITDAQTNKSTYLDFTGDGKTDWAVIRTPRTPDQNYRWKILANQPISAQNPPFIRIFDYGLISDRLLPGDYIGDRKTEATVWRPSEQSIFYVAQFPTGTNGITLNRAVPWGIGGIGRDSSYPQGDYDGDGKMDYTVVRYSAIGVTWYILSSSTSTWRSVDFGFPSGSTLPGADFTGDGRDELVFTSDVNGNLIYYIGDAVTGALVFAGPWGKSSSFIDNNLPPADYTGDGKADLVAVRKNLNRMVWYILDPITNKYTATEFGFGQATAGARPDFPVQGDYDGDGRFDIAVYRYSNQTFYVLKSSDGNLIAQPWGDDGDLPLSIGFIAFFID
jgi:hypothetical protein